MRFLPGLMMLGGAMGMAALGPDDIAFKQSESFAIRILDKLVKEFTEHIRIGSGDKYYMKKWVSGLESKFQDFFEIEFEGRGFVLDDPKVKTLYESLHASRIAPLVAMYAEKEAAFQEARRVEIEKEQEEWLRAEMAMKGELERFTKDLARPIPRGRTFKWWKEAHMSKLSMMFDKKLGEKIDEASIDLSDPAKSEIKSEIKKDFIEQLEAIAAGVEAQRKAQKVAQRMKHEEDEMKRGELMD